MAKIKQKYLYIMGAAAVAVIAALTAVHIYYKDRWYPGSSIDGLKVSGMTYEESLDELKETADRYSITVKGREKGTLTIKGRDIGLKVKSLDSVKELYQKQHKQSVIFSFMKKEQKNLKDTIDFSEKKLSGLVKKSVLVTGDDGYKLTKPEDAAIEYSKEKKYGVLKKEIEGNILDQKAFVRRLSEAIKELKTSMDLTDQKTYPGVYKEPGLRIDDSELTRMQETYNQYLLHWIQWDMGNDTKETMTPEVLKDCIRVNTKKLTVKLDKSAVEDWVEKFCLKYKTVGIARKFTTHSGKKIKVEGGDYGWRIDYDKEIARVLKLLKKAPSKKLMETYQKDPSDKNQKAMTVNLKPVYFNKAYRKDYQNPQNDWDHKNYSEVDLSAQEVFVYKNGKRVFSANCITGKPTPDRITRTGTYYVKEKRLTKTLVGADYSVDTKYWVRIMWTGTGYHWSKRSDWGLWSPGRYKVTGSHGCVNLQLSDAAAIYKLVESGDPVFIHY